MKINSPANHSFSKRGFAIVATVILLSLIIVMFFRFFWDARFENRFANWHDEILEARYCSRAGISFAQFLISRDRLTYDWFEEDWYKLPLYTASSPIPIGRGTVKFFVRDESSKINVNLASSEILEKLFETYKFERVASFALLGIKRREDASAWLTHRILDYIDDDDLCRSLGAEAQEYKALNRPPPRNRPLEDIRELMNIPGISREMFEGSITAPGLRDLLTVFTDGRVNINTTSREVLMTLPGLEDYDKLNSERIVEKIIERRPFPGDHELKLFIIDEAPKMRVEFRENYCTFSQYFEVQSIGRVHNVEKRLTALLYREFGGNAKLVCLTEDP